MKKTTHEDIAEAEGMVQKHDAGEITLAEADCESLKKLLNEWEWACIATPFISYAHKSNDEFGYTANRDRIGKTHHTPEQQERIRRIVAEGEACGFYDRYDRDELRRIDEHRNAALDHMNNVTQC